MDDGWSERPPPTATFNVYPTRRENGRYDWTKFFHWYRVKNFLMVTSFLELTCVLACVVRLLLVFQQCPSSQTVSFTPSEGHAGCIRGPPDVIQNNSVMRATWNESIFEATNAPSASFLSTSSSSITETCFPLGGTLCLRRLLDESGLAVYKLRDTETNYACATYSPSSEDFKRFRNMYQQCVKNWTTLPREFPDCAFRLKLPPLSPSRQDDATERFFIPTLNKHLFLFGVSPEQRLLYVYTFANDRCVMNHNQTKAFFAFFAQSAAE